MRLIKYNDISSDAEIVEGGALKINAVVRPFVYRLFFALQFLLATLLFFHNSVEVNAANTTLNGVTISYGTNKKNTADIINNVCYKTVNSGDTLTLNNVKTKASSASNANNGFKVSKGGTLIVKDCEFTGDRGVHIVLDGGTVYLESGFSTAGCYEFCAGYGTVYVNGGIWQANRHEYGGEGVFYMTGDSTVEMNGGMVGSINEKFISGKSYTTQNGFHVLNGTFTMNGGSIENCLTGVVAKNIYMRGGLIRDCNETSLLYKGNSNNTAAVGVSVADGKAEFTGGRIENCQYGIVNDGVTVFDGTEIKDCDYGVDYYWGYFTQKTYINPCKYMGVTVRWDDYHVTAEGITADSVSDKYNYCGILLVDDCFVDVDEKPRSENGQIGKIMIPEDERYLGKKVVVSDYEKTPEETDYIKQFLPLGFDGWEYRSGTGLNSKEGNVILSKSVKVFYDKNTDEDTVKMHASSGKEYVMNDDRIFSMGYWKEDVNISDEIPVIFRDGKQYNRMSFSHWNTAENDDGIIIEKSGILPAKYMASDQVVYAFYVETAHPAVMYCGNNQNIGNDYIKEWEEDMKFDENIFKKNGYSFVGWSLENDTKYYDDGVFYPGRIIELTEDEWSNTDITEEGMEYVTFFAVWDEVPKVSSRDFSILDEEINSLTFSKVLMYAKAEDTEDGILPEFNTDTREDMTESDVFFKSCRVINYDAISALRYDLKKVNGGALFIKIEGVDGVGNKADGSLWIYVNSSNNNTEISDSYVRSISEKAYRTGDISKGGCLDNSKWYKKVECRNSIEKAFENIRNNTAEESYLLDETVRESALEWILLNGFSKTVEEGAIKDWGKGLDRL